jgi:signal transduction histidine kinase
LEPTVLIVSEHVEFAHAITRRWQMESEVPTLTMMSADLCHELDIETFDIAIIGAVRQELLNPALEALQRSAKPVIHVCEAAQAGSSRDPRSGIMLLRKQEGWLDDLILVASEALLRCAALERIQILEEANAELESSARLGRYVIEMRHSLNNALTSVLGNSELILLESDTLSEAAQSQLQTIHNMGLRIHEVLQRFSSLEKELTVADKQSEAEVEFKTHAAGSSS